MKALIVGLGSIGCRHLNNLSQAGVKHLSVFRSRQLPPPQDVPADVLFFDDYTQALQQKPDVVFICNPTSLHISHALLALQAQAHVYLEKPISHSLLDIDRLADLSKQSGKQMMVGCQLRQHPNLMAIKKWLTDNRLGTIYSVVADVGEHLPDWHPWEDYRNSYSAKESLGGGVILTMIHELDYLYWFFGAMKSVYAIGGHLTSLDIDVEDTALLSMVSKSNIPIQCRMDYWRKPARRTLNVVGATGQIHWDYHQGSAELIDLNGEILSKSELPAQWERNDLFVAMIKNCLDVVAGKAKPLVTLDDGINTLRLALWAKESLKSQQLVPIQ